MLLTPYNSPVPCNGVHCDQITSNNAFYEPIRSHCYSTHQAYNDTTTAKKSTHTPENSIGTDAGTYKTSSWLWRKQSNDITSNDITNLQQAAETYKKHTHTSIVHCKHVYLHCYIHYLTLQYFTMQMHLLSCQMCISPSYAVSSLCVCAHLVIKINT